MARIRFFAALLALLSVVMAVWTAIGERDWIGSVALLAAAACLAAVCPFDAPDRKRRTRVALACAAYVGVMSLLIVYTHNARDSWSATVALFLLLEAGVGLVGWALATRNRSRLPGSRRYYDF
jgi:hypothetical protein